MLGGGAATATCSSRPGLRRGALDGFTRLLFVSATATGSGSFGIIRSAAPASKGRNPVSVDTIAVRTPVSGIIPKLTARARWAGVSEARRRKKGVRESAIPKGITCPAIRSASFILPFIARMNARARQAP